MPMPAAVRTAPALVAALLVLGTFPIAQPAAGQSAAGVSHPIATNEFVAVQDLRWTAPASAPAASSHDVAVVYLEGRPVGEVAFLGRGDEPDVGAVPPAGAARAIVIELQDRPMRSYPNGSGSPLAFPRPGSKKMLENDRVTVWDYTFEPNVSSPLHFHDRDVVVVFLGEGTLASTTPDGTVAVSEHTNGVTRFHPGNRFHTETLIKGTCRVIVVELK